MKPSVYGVGILCAFTLLGCSGKKGDVEETAKKTIGAGGGEIALGGATLTIPQGVLASDTEIVVSRLSGNVPEGYTASSPLYELQPSGLTFASPIQLALTFEGSGAGLAVFLTAAQGDGYEKIAGTVSGQTITAPITHFSRAFAGASAGGAIVLDDWPHARLTLGCRNSVACKSYTSEQACLERVTSVWTLQVENIKKAVAAGRLTFDGSAAKACYDATAAMNTCRPGDQLDDVMALSTPACKAMFTGKVAVGGDCYISQECAEGFCSASSSVCPGKCTAFKQAGETYNSGDQCAFPLIVYDGKCHSRAAVNASCAPIAPAQNPVSCDFGLYCDDTTHVCLTPKTSGDCKVFQECASGYVCDINGTHTCLPSPQLNDACNPSKALGCPSDLACVQVDSNTQGTCGPKRGATESCLTNYDCVTGHYCVGASAPNTGSCQPRKVAQEACTYSADCQDGLYCANKQCAPKKPVGQPCDMREECVSVVCTSKQCAPASCMAP